MTQIVLIFLGVFPSGEDNSKRLRVLCFRGVVVFFDPDDAEGV